MTERKITLEGVTNCRDLGGLEARDGKRIRSGLLLRSAGLTQATEKDLRTLTEDLRLTALIDLRTPGEREKKPDRVPRGAEYLPIPIFRLSMLGITHEKPLAGAPDVAIPEMDGMYRMMVSHPVCRESLGRILGRILTHDYEAGSVLWHCTEGKDRCGIVTALVLTALGIDRAAILADYLLTNEVNRPKAERYYREILAAGQAEADAAVVREAFLAKESYLLAAFSAIDETWGDRETYLREGLGLASGDIRSFREKVMR